MKVVCSLICALMFSLTAHAGFLPLANIVQIHGKALVNNHAVEEGAEITQGMVIKIPKKGDYIIVKYQNYVKYLTGQVQSNAGHMILNYTVKSSLYRG